MQRDILLLTEMIDAAEQAQQLVNGVTVGELEADRQRRDALLWNFTVLREGATRLSEEIKARFPDVTWRQPVRLRNRIVHGYWHRPGCAAHHRERATSRLHHRVARSSPHAPEQCLNGCRPDLCCVLGFRIGMWWPRKPGMARVSLTGTAADGNAPIVTVAAVGLRGSMGRSGLVRVRWPDAALRQGLWLQSRLDRDCWRPALWL